MAKATKNKKNQLPITADEDIKKIPYIIDNYDYIKIGTKSRNGNEGITHIKTMNDGTTCYIEEIKDREKRLIAKTMYRKEGGFSVATAQAGEVKTSETTVAQSARIIPNPNKKVNQKNDAYNQTVYRGKASPKGRLTFTGDGRAIIDLFRNSDPSALIHELGHYYLRLTELLAKNGSITANNDLAEIRKITGNFGGEFAEEQQEIFARQFEAYVFNGKTSSEEARNIFERFSDWLRNIYESIKELNVDFNDDVKNFFDNFLFGTEKQQNLLRERLKIKNEKLKINYEDIKTTNADDKKEKEIQNSNFQLFQGNPMEQLNELKTEIDKYVAQLENQYDTKDEDFIFEQVNIHFGNRLAELEQEVKVLEMAKEEVKNIVADEGQKTENKKSERKKYIPASSAFKENKMKEYIDIHNKNLEKSILDEGYYESLQSDLDNGKPQPSTFNLQLRAE
jgi:hypothetical protein